MVAATLLVWVALRGREARGGAGRAAPAPSAAGGTRGAARPDRPAARLHDLARAAEALRPKTLCNSGIVLLDEDLAPRTVADGLRALTAGAPTSSDVIAALAEWGVDPPEGLDVASFITGGETLRNALDAQVDGELARGSTDPWLAPTLVDLGRLDDAERVARRAYDAAPDADRGETLAYVLDAANRPADARRVLEAELGHDAGGSERIWLLERLAGSCALAADAACVDRAVRGLLESGADPALVAFARGYDLSLRGRLEEANREYARALPGIGDYAAPHNIGVNEACLGRLKEARAWHLRSLAQAGDPDRQGETLTSLAYVDLVGGDPVRAWLLASGGLAVSPRGIAGAEARSILAMASVAQGDVDEARAQVAMAREAAPWDDLVTRRCFAQPFEESVLRALVAEDRGDDEAARARWIEVARSAPPAFASAARRALRRLCP